MIKVDCYEKEMGIKAMFVFIASISLSKKSWEKRELHLAAAVVIKSTL